MHLEASAEPAAADSPSRQFESAPHPASLPAPDEQRLSDVETEVLRLTAATYSGREIGDRLGLELEPVLAVKAGAMTKLGLRTRIQLMEYARHHGWL